VTVGALTLINYYRNKNLVLSAYLCCSKQCHFVKSQGLLETISLVSSVRDLGVYLDADVSTTTHVTAVAAVRHIRRVQRAVHTTTHCLTDTDPRSRGQ